MALTVAIVIHCRYVVFEKTFEDFPNILQGWTIQSSFGHTIDQVAIDSTMNTGYSCMHQDVFFTARSHATLCILVLYDVYFVQKCPQLLPQFWFLY